LSIIFHPDFFRGNQRLHFQKGEQVMKWTSLLAGFTTIGAILFLGSMEAQIQKGKTRPLETKIWMRCVNGPQCTSLAKLLQAGFTDDKSWQEARTNAEMLAESGHVLMADGRCPDATWANATKDLSEGSEAVLKALNIAS
jgi:hypothetical protein